MSETQLVQTSTASIQSSDKIEDTFKKMKVNEENKDQSSPYSGDRNCQFFLRTGQCGYGNSCRYNHPSTHLPQGFVYYTDELPERIEQPDCEYFLKNGACKYGSTCKYHHPKDRNGAGPVLFNVLGYPMRQDEKSCPYYMKRGVCSFGVACKFHHPEPQPHPHNGHSIYGTSGFVYAGGFMIPATYGAMPPPQVPQPHQAYIPFMVAPSQGWDMYMAASNSIYNVKTQTHSMLLNPNNNTGLTMSDSSVSTRIRISLPPSRSDSTTLSNGNKAAAAENHSLEVEKQVHPDKSELQDLSPLSQSDSATLPNGNKATAEIEKLVQPEKSEVQDSAPLSRYDSSTLPNGNKAAAKNHSLEIEKKENGLEEQDKTEVQDSLPPSHSDSTTLANGKTDAESLSLENEKQDDSLAQLDNSKSA